jgi:energy-coupling factor transporter ATP-binding protein EcfA2
MPQITFQTQSQQGPINADFTIDLDGDYIVLVGENNAGKSSILQCIFKRCASHSTPQNIDNVCFLLPDRIYVDTNTQVGGQTLTSYNQELANTIGVNNRVYNVPNNGPFSSNLPKLLLNHTDFWEQLGRLRPLLNYFGFPQSRIQGPQEVTFENISVMFQGSGLRSIFGILAALTDDNIKLLLIDEPELGLEARNKKLLRDLLLEASKQKQIIVSTHSHLFLNRQTYQSNYKVARANGEMSLTPVSSEADLYNITFKLLGSSAEDLFFPNNFLIVEGATDQIIANKIMELKGIDKTKIKVVSASGIDNVENILNAVYNSVLPFVVSDSPYKDRIVALIDQPNTQGQQTYEKLQTMLADRLLELSAPSLEEFFPEELYTRCGKVKTDELREMAKAKHHLEKKRLKTALATAIAETLTRDDLSTFNIFAEAIDKAV